jgi:hypothetical protein
MEASTLLAALSSGCHENFRAHFRKSCQMGLVSDRERGESADLTGAIQTSDHIA